MTLIDGKKISTQLFSEIHQEVENLNTGGNLQPGLAVVIIGDDPASRIYVNSKVKRANELGIHSFKYELPKTASQDEVLKLIQELNVRADVNGILVQSPPPPGIDEQLINQTINPIKDVDCFNPYNVGKMAIGDETGFLPCTPAGIIVLLKRYSISTEGKHAVILGRSNIVGKPMALLLSSKRVNSTVTICHSRTTNLRKILLDADIIVAAIGKPNFVTADMVKNDVIIIDVGINRIPDPDAKKGYKLVGDVDFAGVSPKASFITPVPGGVGPMTIAMLMYNAVKGCCIQNNVKLPKSLI